MADLLDQLITMLFLPFFLAALPAGLVWLSSKLSRNLLIILMLSTLIDTAIFVTLATWWELAVQQGWRRWVMLVLPGLTCLGATLCYAQIRGHLADKRSK